MSPLNYFLLALLVFVLTVAIMLLHNKLKRSRILEEGGSIREKEQRLFKLYQNLEDMIASVEDYVEDTQRIFEKERAALEALAKELHEAPRVFTQAAQMESEYLESSADLAISSVAQRAHLTAMPRTLSMFPSGEAAAKHNAPRSGFNKTAEVRKLNGMGLSKEMIAKELGMSHGEISLILGMLIK